MPYTIVDPDDIAVIKQAKCISIYKAILFFKKTGY